MKLRALFIAFSLCGCYDPNGENFVEVEIPDFKIVDISFNDTSTSLYVFQKTALNFRIDSDRRPVQKIEGFLNGISLFDPNFPKQIIIDPVKFGSGEYTLRVDVSVSAESNSLADKLGLEVDKISKEFDLVIDLHPPEGVNQVAFRVEDGQFIIDWDVPSKTNFASYQLSKFVKNGTDWSGTPQKQFIIDKSKNSFKDSTYLGGPVQYSLDLLGEGFIIQGAKNEFDTALVVIEYKLLGGLTYEISWEPTLYNNVTSLSLSGLGSTLNFDNTPNSTTIDFEFGKYSDHTFRVYSSKTDSYAWYHSKFYIGEDLVYKNETTEVRGAPIKLGDNYFVIESGDNFFIANKVDNETTALVSRLDHSHLLAPIEYSGNNNYLAINSTNDNAYFSVNQTVYKFNASFDHIGTIDLSSIVLNPRRFIYKTQIYRDQLIAFSDASDISVKILKLETLEVLYDEDGFQSISLSSDGKYLVNGDEVVLINNDFSVTPAWTLPTKCRDVVFTDNSDRFICSGNEGLKLYDIPSKTLVKTYDFIGSELSYDEISNKVGCQGGGLYFIVDLSTDEDVTLKVNKDQSYFIRDNTLYSSNGFALEL